jgi:hypothetical protein
MRRWRYLWMFIVSLLAVCPACNIYDQKLIDRADASSIDVSVVVDSRVGDVEQDAKQNCVTPTTETCDGKDNDCDGETDEEEAHAECSQNNAIGRCTLGQCSFDHCVQGFGDCDQDFSNGCERALNTPDNCGACDYVCGPLDRARSVTCVDGVCTAEACELGYGDCDGDPANGCETRVDDLDNCGACGVSCDLDNCAGGVCTAVPCEAGMADCDRDPDNGCETSLRTTMDCVVCGKACYFSNATASCESGECEFVSCRPGWGDCNDDRSDGCETALNTMANCGACGRECDPEAGEQSCVGGKCTGEVCEAGYGDCDGDPSNGCETALNTLEQCGACDTPCESSDGQLVTCESGSCELIGCAEGFYDCDEDPLTGCESRLKDDINCGACGQVCSMDNATATCASGSCELVACDLGYQDCNQDQTDGCEAKIGTNEHCAGCGDTCAEGFVCESGSCVSGCTPEACGGCAPLIAWFPCCKADGSCGCAWPFAPCL